MGTFGTPSSYNNTGSLGSATNPTTAQGLSRDRENQKAILELPGTQVWVEKTITDGVIIPTSAEIIVLPEGGASTDSLTTIALTSDGTTTLHDGMLIRLKAANSNVITVVHGTGTNSISTVDGNNVVLDTTWYLELKLISGLWVQQETSAYKTATAAALALVTRVTNLETETATQQAAIETLDTGLTDTNKNLLTLSRQNRLYNGDFRIDQINTGAAVTPAAPTYVVDNGYLSMTQASKLASQRVSASANMPLCPFSERITVATAYTVAATDYFSLDSYVEGVDFADLLWGTANAKPITVSFQLYVSVAGTYAFSLRNAAGTYSYVFTAVLTAGVNTVTATIAGCISGVWPTGAAKCLVLSRDLGSGANYRTNNINAWLSGNYIGATGATSLVATSGAVYEFSKVQIEKGSFATPFEVLPYQQALGWCQRYYNAMLHPVIRGYNVGGNNLSFGFMFPTRMRVPPTLSYGISPTLDNCTLWNLQSTVDGYTIGLAVSSTGTCLAYNGKIIADAQM